MCLLLFYIDLINFFILTFFFAGQRIYVDYLGGLVLSRTSTCHEIIIPGRHTLEDCAFSLYASGVYACKRLSYSSYIQTHF